MAITTVPHVAIIRPFPVGTMYPIMQMGVE